MKFKDLYSNCEHLEEVAPSIIYSKNRGNCYICRKETNFIDIDFECYICSEECEHQMSEDYMTACKK